MTKNVKHTRVTHLSLALAVECMLDGAMTSYEIAEHTGLHQLTVGKLQRALRESNAAFVCAWSPDRQGRMVIPVYQIGRGKDAPRPKPLTQQQRNARRQAKIKAVRLHRAVAGLPMKKRAQQAHFDPRAAALHSR